MSARLIVLEGLDGSGKSTVAAGLAQRLGAALMTTPGELLRGVRARVLQGLQTPVARQVFYLATVEEASEEARNHLSRGRSVVLDRYLLSTMVYAVQRGPSLRWPELEQRLLPADLTVFLDLPLPVRRQRLARRGAGEDDRETLAEVFDQGVRRRYLDWSTHPTVGRFVHLDLSGAEPPEAIVDDLLERLELRGAVA